MATGQGSWVLTAKFCTAMILLLALAGAALASAPEPQQQVLVQFSVGTGTTLVGFKVTRQAVKMSDAAYVPDQFCLRLPFGCALVMGHAAADGSGVIVRPQVGSLAFEVAVGQSPASGS